MTMRELAKLANVSVSTVSKAFLEADDVSRETKNHIFAIAKEHGCFGKYYKGKYYKKIIAIICPELRSNYYATYVEQFQEIIEKDNGIVLISTDHFDANVQGELIEYYASYLRVDGIIVFDMKCKLKKGYATPVIALGSTEDNAVDTVNITTKQALMEAVKYLHNLGHKNIAFIGENLTQSSKQTFIEAMQHIGETNPKVYESAFRFEKAGEDGIQMMHRDKADCTAIICGYDNIAYGAIKELKNHNLRVPEDISIIGSNNINTSRYMETSLSSIGTNAKEVCMIVWDLLSKKMSNPYFKSNQQILIQGELVIRESVSVRDIVKKI